MNVVSKKTQKFKRVTYEWLPFGGEGRGSLRNVVSATIVVVMDFFCQVRKHWCYHRSHGLENPFEHCQNRPPFNAIWRTSIKAILGDIKIQGRKSDVGKVVECRNYCAQGFSTELLTRSEETNLSGNYTQRSPTTQCARVYVAHASGTVRPFK